MATKAQRKKGSRLHLTILVGLVVLLAILLRIETRPRENQPASHESFIAQTAYRR
jgi:hypothetical protein